MFDPFDVRPAIRISEMIKCAWEECTTEIVKNNSRRKYCEKHAEIAKKEKREQWKKNNLEKTRQTSKKWRKDNLERNRQTNKIYAKNNSEKRRQINNKSRRNNPEKTMFKDIKQKVKKRNLEFNLDLEWLIEKWKIKHCPITGIEFTPTMVEDRNFHRDPFIRSIDRINSKKGYTKDNCRIVCLWVNQAMNEYGEELFYEMCERVVENRRKMVQCNNDLKFR